LLYRMRMPLKFYKVNQDLDGLKFVSPENHNMRTVVGEDNNG